MTCDHPNCSDDVHKTYHDDNDNDLGLCEAHYYYLVSGETRPRTSPDPFGGRALDLHDPAESLDISEESFRAGPRER